MKPATKEQVMAINATLNKLGLMDDKKEIIKEASGGRTESSKELTLDEAKALLKSLLQGKAQPAPTARHKMISKIFALAHEMGWVEKQAWVVDGKLTEANDYTKVYQWIKKYGYLKKDLKEYKYNEIPKLLSQFEFGPYAHHLKNQRL